MLTVGTLLKSLRKERHLTQEELAKGITTRTTLASIENKNSKISFELLVQLLDRLNVRIEEFLLHLDEGIYTKKQDIYRKIYKEYYSKDQLSNNLERTLLNEYKDTKDFLYIALYTQMLGMQKRNKDNLTLKKERELNENIKLIKDHLRKVENWNHMELVLFTNSLYLFESSYIEYIYKRILKKMESLKKLKLYQDDMFVFLHNCINLFLERDQNHLVNYFLKELESRLTRKNQLYEKTLTTFYRAIHDIRTGKTEAVERIRYILNYLEFLEENEKVAELRNDVEKYTRMSI